MICILWQWPNNVVYFTGHWPSLRHKHWFVGTLGSPSCCLNTRDVRLFLLVCILCSCFFQLIFSSKSWKGSPILSSMDANQILEVMLKSRADATAKFYMRFIKKFLGWCKSRQISIELPFPIVSYLCIYSKSSSLVLPVLLWFWPMPPRRKVAYYSFDGA